MNIDEVPGWFPQTNRIILTGLIKQYQIKTVLEIGSFLGLSAIWFAMQGCKVTCVDTWKEEATEPNGNNLVTTLGRMGTPRDFFHVFQNNVREFGVEPLIRVVRCKSSDSPAARLADVFDLVYVDGDHTLEGCRSDLKIYGPKTRKVLCGDDFVDRPEFGVIQAAQEYVKPGRLNVVAPFWWTVKE